MLATNPWAHVPATPDYVLPEDDAVLRTLPGARSELKLHLLPVPFLGDPRRAKVMLLGLNPSYHAESDQESADEVGQLRLALTFQSRTPFFNFDPAFRHTYGYEYWSLLLGALIRRFDLEHVGRTVAVVEWCPYGH